MALRGEPSDFTSVLHSGTSTGTGLKFGITALRRESGTKKT